VRDDLDGLIGDLVHAMAGGQREKPERARA